MLARNFIPASSRGLLRRRWPRFEVGGNITAQIDVLELVMPVRDISLGGFSVEAPMRFAIGEIHEFQLCLGDVPPQHVRARTAYCRPGRDREQVFMIGWEALGDPDTARAMAELVDRVVGTQEPA
jgi:hypothetical protein